jgi:hypothetical protein
VRLLRRSLWLWLVAGSLASASPVRATDSSRQPHSAFEGVAGLAKPVTSTETKIPLGELVQKVAADTGVKLSASPEVADEPVAVVVKDLPARELLEQVADLLDYLWSKRGKPGEERYEIWQDLPAKQREQALREAVVREAEREFQEQVRQYVEIAALPEARFARLVADAEKEAREREKLPPERRQTRSRTPLERAQIARYGVALALRAEVTRAVTPLLGRLTEPQWARLRERGDLNFSTDPKQGELQLPVEIERGLRAARPTYLPPGSSLAFPTPDEEEKLRQKDQGVKEAWAAASGFRVWLRMHTEGLRSHGALALNASVTPFRAGGPLSDTAYVPPIGGPSGTALFLLTAPPAMRELLDEDTPERRALLEKDPVVGAPKLLKPERKPSPNANGPAAPAWWRLRDLLPDLARAYDVQFLSDAYWHCSPGLDVTQISVRPAPLFSLLDRAVQLSQRWDRRGRLIRLRSRTWFLDRPREVPLRFVRGWQAQIARHAGLPLDTYAEMATHLTDAQLGTVGDLPDLLDLPRDLSSVDGGRHALRLYAALSSDQRQSLWRGEGLSVAGMSPAQRALFTTALKEALRVPADEIDPARLAGARFTMKGERQVRLKIGEGGQASFRDGPPMTGESDSPAEAGPPPTPAAGRRATVTRHPITILRFYCQYGTEERETANLTVASP